MPSPSTGVIDYSACVRGFFLLTRDGKLDVVRRAVVTPEHGVKILMGGLDISILSPLIAEVRRSSLQIVVKDPGEPRASYAMRVKAGNQSRTVPAIGSREEIISRALDDGSLPIIVQSEAERALASSEPGPVQIPTRSLRLREHLPKTLGQCVRELALANALNSNNRLERLTALLKNIRSHLRDMILSDYLMKCVWLNKRGGQLGSIVNEDGQVRFQAFDSDEPEISDFLCALEKDPYGEFLLDFREFGEVLPTPKRSNPWLGPTVHINKADFRTEFGLEETYSLYAGFRALSAIGAPVLLFEGQNPLLKPTQIRFLKVTHRSLNVLQGRILEGDMYAGVREFTAQSLVW